MSDGTARRTVVWALLCFLAGAATVSAAGLGIPSPSSTQSMTRIVKAIRIWVRTIEGRDVMTKICFLLVAAVSVARAAAVPAPQQNVIIAKYCAPCHDVAHRNGGLSLQHFDAAKTDPGVAEMVLAKLTNGLRSSPV